MKTAFDDKAPTEVRALPKMADLSRSLSASKGALSDRRWSLALATLGQPLAAIMRHFDRCGIADNRHELADEHGLQAARAKPHAPLLFECDNSVPGVLALLALLLRRTSFVLVPAPRAGTPSIPAPESCRLRLRVSPDAEGSLEQPQHLLPIDALGEGVAQIRGSVRPASGPTLGPGHVLLRTSGSLGPAKLVVHRHESLLANAYNVIDRLDLQAKDRVSIPVPIAHMYGLGAALLPALWVGASVDLLANANVLRYLEREREFTPTVTFSTPNLCRMLARPRVAPSHYRHIVAAGDKLSAPLLAKLEPIYRRVVNLYGSTELGVICAGDPRRVEGEDATKVGRPLPGVELGFDSALGPDAGAVEGELWCRHPFAFEGYYDPAQDGLLPRQAGSALRTSDLARRDADGLIEVLGRSDHAVKRDGRLVSLAEVELALEQLPGVARAAALVEGESRRGRGIVAFCLPSTPMSIEPQRLRRACQAVLPAHAVPDQIRAIEALPTLPSGKLDRLALRHYLTTPQL